MERCSEIELAAQSLPLTVPLSWPQQDLVRASLLLPLVHLQARAGAESMVAMAMVRNEVSCILNVVEEEGFKRVLVDLCKEVGVID